MNTFTIRVYGILIDHGRLLVSDEYIKGREITKLPGGGLEFGEGTLNCLMREFKEELDMEIKVLEHFYTTDFFVPSAFNPQIQVMSIYYTVSSLHPILPEWREAEAHFPEKKEGAQSFRWIKLHQLSENDFTFAIDKKVAQLLNRQYTKP